MSDYVRIAGVGEIPPGSAKAFEVSGREIAVFHLDDGFYAISNTCSHKGARLCDGTIVGSSVLCPWHGAEFRITTGEALTPPARIGVPSYPVRVRGEDLEVQLPAS